jgi:signal transduction histidine kinase
MFPALQPTARAPEAASSTERSLARAFAAFTEAAGSLERSYGQLQLEVTRLRRELEEAKGELERERELHRRQQALAEMSTLLAHEIRTPLGSLELFAGLLAEAGLDGERRTWVAHLQAGLRTLAATVNNVLHFHGRPLPQLLPTDLGQLLRWTGEFLEPLAQQAKVQLEVVNGLNGVCVAADPHRLQQVLLNLALNAFRCMPQGGTLRLCGNPARSTAPGQVEIQVGDTGCGITPEVLQRIFEPGFTTRPGSPGLGLAVCRKVMEQHGGHIGVNSRPGEGTTFVLNLPLPGGVQ